MKYLKQGVCLALLGAGLAAVPGIQAAAAGTTGGGSLVEQMRDTAQGSVALSTSSATGKVGFIRAGGQGDLMPTANAESSAQAVDKATAYLDKYAGAFGARADELHRTTVQSGTTGWTVSFSQSYQGVPVFGSMIKAHLDEAGDLTAVNGYAAPGLSLSTTPSVSADDAGSRAVATVRANPPGEAAAGVTKGIKAADERLVVYRTGAIKGEAGENVLAWQVEVTNKANVRDMVFVDAQTGKLLNRYSMATDALDRELYEAFIDDNGTPDDENDDFVDFDLVWAENDPFPGSLNADQQNLVNTSGDSYWLYENTFGRDSYDGGGAAMLTVNNDPRIECPNANWNGITTNYCDGVTSDDVVAHEWGHAYTEYTSGLIYQWQPGALNESYSDVWGETIDLINGRDDEGEGDIESPRPVGVCSSHSPPTPVLTINSPAGIAKECLTGGYLGPDPMPTVTGDVVAPTDADEDADADTYTDLDGCSTYDDEAAADGKVVLVNRGGCTFVQKSQVAKAAGATALIIGNRDDSPVGFSSDDQTLPPTVSIGLTDREAIRAALTNGAVNVTIEDGSGERYDSYRWLIGEKSEAFGGAIRDMWSPTCYGDPGKVSDAEYKCSTDDSGGVHGNSGVPNHAYALLVDGGDFNGTTVTGIGLDKAANIYWETQKNYLTPTSDFSDMADGLEAACTALTGESLNELSVDPENPGAADVVITPADCASVSAAIEATELRQEPTQCNFQPLLAKGAPSVCGEGYASKTLWKEDFDKGLRDWTKSQDVVFAGGRGFPWRATTEAPHHSSKAAFVPDPQGGNCSLAEGDISSSDAITSSTIRLPLQGVKAPRLSFEHYVATETGYDGGNVWIKLNGRPFEQVPASVIRWNAYNSTLVSAAEGNTNPLAGQDSYTGTNGGSVFGSWGKTYIDLAKLGVNRGDNLKIRFDFGRDGCGGNDGWYVDDVKIVSCTKAARRHQELGTKS